MQKCATRDEADDLFQEVALRFCKKAGELNNQVYLFEWFQTVLLHCHYNDYRKRHRVHEIPFSSLAEPQRAYDARGADAYIKSEENISKEALVGEFSLLLETLNPLEKMIVELSVVCELSLRDLSELIGLSKGCIAHRRQIAFKKMQEKMEMQKNQIKMITGREATLREIIECIG